VIVWHELSKRACDEQFELIKFFPAEHRDDPKESVLVLWNQGSATSSTTPAFVQKALRNSFFDQIGLPRLYVSA
jgi:hypothetical protein